MPQDQSKATIFGDVLHAVCERFLRADDRGLDEKGQPVNLYPTEPDWRTMYNRFDKTKTLYSVSDTEAALIKTLVAESISQGVLVREPGRKIEKDVECVIHNKGFVKVVLRGFVDLDNPREITDHKSAKSTKWILSKKKLVKSIQMMGYAKAKLIEGHQGNIWLTHNNFIKDFDTPKVIKRSVEVTQMEVEEFFQETMLPLVKRMLDLYIKYPKHLIHQWRKIPGANDPNRSCNYHYGKPCPYIGVCGGTCTIDTYLMKYGKTINELVGNIEQINELKGNTMNSLIAKAKAEQEKHAAAVSTAPVATAPVAVVPLTAEGVAGAVAETHVGVETPVVAGGLSALINQMANTAEASAPAAVAVEAPVVAAVAPAAEVPVAIAEPGVQIAPWCTPHADGTPCKACSDSKIRGYNYKLDKACMICDINAKAAGKPTSLDYDVAVGEGGILSYSLKGRPATTVQVAEVPEVKTEIAPVIDIAATVVETVISNIAAPATANDILANMSGLAAANAVHITAENAMTAEVVIPAKTLAAAVVEKTNAAVDVLTMPGVAIAEAMKETSPKPVAHEGFTLLIGCAIVSEISKYDTVLSADDVLGMCLEEIAAAAGKEVSAIDHFALMQAIDSLLPSIADCTQAMMGNLAGKTIVSVKPSKGSALERLIDGLRPYADTVIHGLMN